MLKYFTKYAKKKKPEIRKKYQKKDEMKYETALQKKNFSQKSLDGGAIGQTLSQRIQFNFHNCNRIGIATFTFHFSHSEFPRSPPLSSLFSLSLSLFSLYAKWAWPESEPAKLAPHAPHDHRL